MPNLFQKVIYLYHIWIHHYLQKLITNKKRKTEQHIILLDGNISVNQIILFLTISLREANHRVCDHYFYSCQVFSPWDEKPL